MCLADFTFNYTKFKIYELHCHTAVLYSKRKSDNDNPVKRRNNIIVIINYLP